MAFVQRYGGWLSEDGWRFVDEAECDWMSVPGTSVTLQIRKGIPATILTHFARRFNEAVEPLRDQDSACWTPTNDVATSNHLSATGMDLNWNSHPFHAKGTFGDKLPALRNLLDNEFRGCVWWGGDWTDPIDEMHFQLNYREGYFDDGGNWVEDVDQRLVDLANSLPAPPPLPLSRADQYALAIIGEGRRLGITPRGIQIALSVALVESNLQNYANSNDPPSLDLPHDAVGSDHMSSGVFQQQPWWGPLECRMDVACSANLFYTVDKGPGTRGLTKIRDSGGDLYDYNDTTNSPGFYAQKVQGSAFPDRYDQRFAEACDLYARLAGQAPPEEEDWMSALSPEEQRLLYDRTNQLWGAMFNENPSKSRYGDPKIVWPNHMYIRNIDGHIYDLIVEHDAGLGDVKALGQIRKAATAGDTKAQAFLERLAALQGSAPPAPQNNTTAPITVSAAPTGDVAEPTPPSGVSLSAAVDQFGQQMAQANADFAQRMTDFKSNLNALLGG